MLKSYLGLEAKIERTFPENLAWGVSQKNLAKRLGCSTPRLRKGRDNPDNFANWTRDRDPEGRAWTYSAKTTRYYPLPANSVAEKSAESQLEPEQPG